MPLSPALASGQLIRSNDTEQQYQLTLDKKLFLMLNSFMKLFTNLDVYFSSAEITSDSVFRVRVQSSETVCRVESARRWTVWVTIMCIRKYALLLRICIIVTQTVQGHDPDRICIPVHRGQQIHMIFMNTHYNHFFYEVSEPWLSLLKSLTENWNWEKFWPVIFRHQLHGSKSIYPLEW